MIMLLLLMEKELIKIMSRSKSRILNASSSIGRVAVSKTVGWGFESLLAWI